ncbi:hypothetical protein [Bacillus mycoides]|jgi:tRNA (cmo5U34)-methyltransferase|uniref:hypothetical protein n=1 Tax=Bacillus mycoides TaxID=1405 RepID=UPI0018790FC2
MLQHQIPIEDWNRFESSFKKEIFPISEVELLALMNECGFTHTSFLVNGYMAIKQC